MRALLLVLAFASLMCVTGCPASYYDDGPPPDVFFYTDGYGTRVYYTYDSYGNIVYFD